MRMHSDAVFEELQHEIDQLRNEKGSLQQALSESETALADLKHELASLQNKVYLFSYGDILQKSDVMHCALDRWFTRKMASNKQQYCPQINYS